MTTALPHPTASLRPQPDTRHLHLVADGVRQDAEDPASPPLVGYLLLVPQGTDPLDLFVKDRPRPEFRLVAADMTAEVTAGATAPPRGSRRTTPSGSTPRGAPPRSTDVNST